MIFDEPVNGLDPEGVLWVRNLARRLAAEDKTVFLSSHLMSEMSQTADHLIVIGRGQIIADAPIQDVLEAGTGQRTQVRCDRPYDLARSLAGDGISVDVDPTGLMEVAGLDNLQIARIAFEHRIIVYELIPRKASLEEVYMELTKNEVEYRSAALTGKGK